MLFLVKGARVGSSLNLGFPPLQRVLMRTGPLSESLGGFTEVCGLLASLGWAWHRTEGSTGVPWCQNIP